MRRAALPKRRAGSFRCASRSEGYRQIGGNFSTNGGGTAVLRHSSMRDLVLGVEAVLPDSRVYSGLRALHAIERDEDLMGRIRAGWDAFQPFMDSDTPPPLTEADTAVRSDSAWIAAATAYAEAKRQADAQGEQLEEARQALMALAQHPKESGGGVSVTRYWKQGNVDYKRIPALQGLDLSTYRGKARQEVRVTAET